MSRLALCCVLLATSSLFAHDTWVETNTNLIRTGDSIYVDLKLGNHGNEHRDFKLASKVDLASCTLALIDPEGTEYDLKPSLIDVGYAPKEGYWTTKFVPGRPGMYVVSHTLDSVVNHGKPQRSIKSGKTCFVVSNLLDRVPFSNPGFDKPLGHPLELVPTSNPVTPMGPGETIRVQVLFQGQPVDGMKVSFIPQDQTLKADFDEEYERLSGHEGGNGIASFTPKTGGRYLVVVHHETDETGTDYESTKYSATLTVFVPELCPCCE